MGETEHETIFETSELLTSRINPSIILQTGQSFIFKCVTHNGWGKFSDLQCICDPSFAMIRSLVEQATVIFPKNVPYEKLC